MQTFNVVSETGFCIFYEKILVGNFSRKLRLHTCNCMVEIYRTIMWNVKTFQVSSPIPFQNSRSQLVFKHWTPSIFNFLRPRKNLPSTLVVIVYGLDSWVFVLCQRDHKIRNAWTQLLHICTYKIHAMHLLVDWKILKLLSSQLPVNSTSFFFDFWLIWVYYIVVFQVAAEIRIAQALRASITL